MRAGEEGRARRGAQVDYSTFEAAVQSYDEQVALKRRMQGVSMVVDPSLQSPSRGAEFREALTASVGAHAAEVAASMSPSLSSTLPAEFSALPQSERVRRLSRQLSTLFEHYDSGAMSKDLFREELRRMGLAETSEVERLLRSAGRFRFSDLYRALCLESDLIVSGGEAAGTRTAAAVGPARALRVTDDTLSRFGPHVDEVHAHTGRRRVVAAAPPGAQGAGSAQQQHAADIIAWRGARAADVAAAVSTGRYDDRAARATGGVAAALGWEGDAGGGAAVVRASVAAEAAPGEALAAAGGSGRASSRWTQAGSGVAGALRDTADPTPDAARFETSAQADARRGIRTSTPGAITSAGYGGKDGGLLREQLYSLVRQLDAGSLTIGGFRGRLRGLAVDEADIPPLERLLSDYASNGTADFGRFVRAFEDFLTKRVGVRATGEDASAPALHAHAHAHAHALAHAHAHVPAAPQPPSPGGSRVVRGHGDIVSWAGVAVDPAAERDNLRRLGFRPVTAGSKPRTVFDMTPAPTSHDAIHVGHGASDRVSRKAPGEADTAARRSAGNIVAWADDRDRSTATHATVHPPTYYQHRLTASAVRDRHGGAPFGTERDM
jgi:hypothetical protein